MDCEEYAVLMLDAALGAPASGREAELRTHIPACAACRAAQQDAAALAAAVGGGVAAVVAGEPSPQFAARLRARIAAEPAPVAWPWFAGWRSSLGVAVAAAAAFLLLRMPHHAVPAPPNVPAASLSARAPDLPVTRTAPATVRRAIAREPHRARNGADASPFAHPEILVPKGQLALAVWLDDALTGRKLDGRQIAALDERVAAKLEVKAIEIAPLEVPSLASPGNASAAESVEQGRQ